MEKNNLKHGYYKTRIYVAWNNMKKRCYYIKSKSFKNYGGRGISVCEEWKNDFKLFLSWALENGYDETLTLDRINVNGNYEPDNCRWITNQKQQLNRTNNRNVTYLNSTKTLSEWSSITGKAHKTLEGRLNSDWSIEDAFNKPIQTKISEIQGRRFGKITVVSFSHTAHGAYWNCVCDCGNHKIIRGTNLTSGATKSCGCIQRIAVSNYYKNRLIAKKEGVLCS